jgi:hypothetical protein
VQLGPVCVWRLLNARLLLFEEDWLQRLPPADHAAFARQLMALLPPSHAAADAGSGGDARCSETRASQRVSGGGMMEGQDDGAGPSGRGGATTTPATPYGDEIVANREIRVWHFVIEKGP